MRGDKMTDKIARGMAVALFVVVLVAGWAMACAPPAPAQPNPYVPYPPFYCAGGGGQFGGFGGFCDGRTFPDGTKLHMANGMGIWAPMTCVIADAPAPPPLAGPGGCGGYFG